MSTEFEGITGFKPTPVGIFGADIPNTGFVEPMSNQNAQDHVETEVMVRVVRHGSPGNYSFTYNTAPVRFGAEPNALTAHSNSGELPTFGADDEDDFVPFGAE